MEHILLRSRQEPEEKKLPFMAHLFANLAFDSTIDVHMAHQLTKAAELLTYRQLCLLRLAAVKDKFGLRNRDYRGQSSFSISLYPILYEIYHLHNLGYMHAGDGTNVGCH